MINFKKILLSSILIGTSLLANAAPFGREIRTFETVEVEIFGNTTASCTAQDRFGNSILLVEFVGETTTPFANLFGISGGQSVTCIAPLLLLRTDTVTREVIQYAPLPRVDSFPNNFDELIIVASAQDFDGQVTNIQLFLNGTLQGGTSTLAIGPVGSTVNVRVVATDDDGHSETINRTLVIQRSPNSGGPIQ